MASPSHVVRKRYRALPLIGNPLELEESEHGHGHGEAHAAETQDQTKEGSYLQVTPGPSSEVPAFREREEASSIELFYDLFFVANLTSFTTAHAIDDTSTLSSYVGFFTLLWFTWFQVVLYDVRFGVDSIFERTCKVIHFGVLITFAVVGISFDPDNIEENYVNLRKLSLVMMVSRLVLLCQYGSILHWVKGYKNLVLPLGMYMVTLAVNALIFLGIFFSFTSTNGSGRIGWYIICALEVIIAFVISGRYRAVSFKRTNLTERCSLLTLIILGEGIIVLTKSISNIVKGGIYPSTVVGQIISAVLIIYFVYMLYFDSVDHHGLGTIRQQFWASAHFPFHVALVLFMEGTSRLITWMNALEFVNTLGSQLTLVYFNGTTGADVAGNLEAYAELQLEYVQADAVKFNITGYIADLANVTDVTSDEGIALFEKIYITVTNAAFKFFKIQASKSTEKKAEASSNPGSKDPLKDLGAIFTVYDVVFVYFFVAAGITLMLLSLLMVLNKKNKCLGDWSGIALRFLFGFALSMISVISLNSDRQINFLASPWMLPTAVLTLGLLVLIDGILGYLLPAPASVESKGHHSPESNGSVEAA